MNCLRARRLIGLALLVVVFHWLARPAGAEKLAPLTKPYLVVEGWFDRPYCSDLYAFDFEGKLLRRLTREPLPSCALKAVSGDGNVVTFVGDASALYCLLVAHHIEVPLHAGDSPAVALSRDGRGAAYVARGFEAGAPLYLHVQPLVAGAPFSRVEVAVPAQPAELQFTPDAKQVLLTIWAGGRAEIFACELDGKAIRPLFSEPGVSYSEPTFSPDAKSLVLVREKLETGEGSIIASSWPKGEAKLVRAGARGITLSSPVFTADSKQILFEQNGVLAKMAADGSAVESLGGPLDDAPRQVIGRGLRDRPRPQKQSSAPLQIGRWIPRIEYTEPDGKLVLIDVRTKERKPVPLPKGNLRAAVVIE